MFFQTLESEWVQVQPVWSERMAVNLAELILSGLLVEWVFRKGRLPGLIGLLLLGVVGERVFYKRNVFV